MVAISPTPMGGPAMPPLGAPGAPAGGLPLSWKLPLPDTKYVGDAPAAEYDSPLDVVELRKQFEDYVTIKQSEIIEQRAALQYYHGDQWTKEQLDTLLARGQPVITFNRIARKVDGLIGVLEKLRGDPKAYARVEGNEHGAELATQCVRYALDTCDWPSQESEALRKGACTGICVAELALIEGDKGDPDIELQAVDVTTFFYDPRSVRLDYSDCRYMGVSKLMTEDEFEELFPGKWDDAMGTIDDTGQTMFDNDRYFLWAQGRTKLRLVEHWYRHKGDWHFAFYAGTELLQAGISPFHDEKGKTISRYEAFAVHVDVMGDHYGFVRNLIGPQDAMNQHRSKSVHIMNTRQLVVERSALGGDQPDIETLRREAARPDGVILYDGDPGKVRIEQAAQEFLQQTQYFSDARNEIETFGPNPALASGQGPADVSGRSLAMQQQSGVAELGPFLRQWRAWKLRLYRKIWVQQQRNWTAERVLRVTNDKGAAQYVSINRMEVDQWGRPMLVNAVGQLDVDIIVDEGADGVNVMADINDTLIALAHNNVPVPPQVIIQTSSLPQSKKQMLIEMLSQQSPEQVAAQQEELAQKKAKTQKLQASAASDVAKAQHNDALTSHEKTKEQATRIGAAIQAMDAHAPPESGGPSSDDQQAGGASPPAAASSGSPGATPPAPGGLPQVPAGYGAQRVPPGARQAPDGHYYIYAPHEGGNWRKVVFGG
jgi:hypothetical protein